MALHSVEFEVFGDVQDLFFKKYALKEANRLGIKGWLINTPRGTVAGVIEGTFEAVQAMKEWLETKGGPTSLIDTTEFKNEKKITEYSYDSFDINRAPE